MDRHIFVSIGTPSTEDQEKALGSLDRVLESRGLRRREPPYSTKAPLINVRETLDQCDGMIVVAYPRIRIEKGSEHPSSTQEKKLHNVNITTSWNHMEPAFAYDRGLPLMILRDKSVKVEGFLEHTYDWEVTDIEFSPSFFETNKFASLVNEFAGQIEDYKSGRWQRFSKKRPSDLADRTVRDIVSNLRWSEAWALLGAAATLLGGTFYAGHKLGSYLYGAG